MPGFLEPFESAQDFSVAPAKRKAPNDFGASAIEALLKRVGDSTRCLHFRQQAM